MPFTPEQLFDAPQPKHPVTFSEHALHNVPGQPICCYYCQYLPDQDITDLVFDMMSLPLVAKDFWAGLLSFHFVNVLHQYVLVLEDITFGLLIK